MNFLTKEVSNMKIGLPFVFFLLLLISSINTVKSQVYNEDVIPEINPSSIPSAPAFSLLGVNPELVTRPADVKEFKVDWRIKNYKVAPDLAIEGQPLWQFYYRKMEPRDLFQASKLERILSTTSLSLATAKIDNTNHLSWAMKFNLYKESDPLFDAIQLKNKQTLLDSITRPLEVELDSLTQLLVRYQSEKDSARLIRQKMLALNDELSFMKKRNMDALEEEAHAISAKNWNKSMVDVGFGKVYTYDNSAVDSLNFQKAGWGIWVNAAKGIKNNGLVTGLLRINKIGVNVNTMLGASYRYGSERYNFFAEVILNQMNNIPENGFLEEEQFQANRAEDLGTGWYSFNKGESLRKWTVSYGGDFRLRKNILLNFALRTNLTQDFSFKSMVPIANVICLMQ